jgi:hypothetical protein
MSIGMAYAISQIALALLIGVVAVRQRLITKRVQRLEYLINSGACKLEHCQDEINTLKAKVRENGSYVA